MNDAGRNRNQSGGWSNLDGGLSLGRIAGVDVRLHWTWVLIAGLLTIILAGDVFPADAPGLTSGVYLAMGVATALLFFASLLLHELGHALAARREGVPTRRITLWMLGGVARSGAAFPSPGAEARIALAGPAVSAALGGALVGAGQIASLPAALSTALEWLGWTNMLLLAFNLLPALPLDGGRVLRAGLWRVMHGQLRATRAAVRVSQAISVALIAVGAVGAVGAGAIGGLWLALIGFFLFSAATAELGSARWRSALDGMHVADLMTPDPVTIDARATAEYLLELAQRTGHSAYPVINEVGDAIGLVPTAAALRLPERRRPWVTVRELAAPIPALMLDADAELLEAVPGLVANPLHNAAVLRAGHLVGLLSLGRVIDAVRLQSR